MINRTYYILIAVLLMIFILSKDCNPREGFTYTEAPSLIRQSRINKMKAQYADNFCTKQPFIGKARGYLNWQQIY